MDSYENEASKFAAQRTKLKNICEAQKHITVRIKSGLLRVFLGKWLSCVPSTAFPMMKICSST